VDHATVVDEEKIVELPDENHEDFPVANLKRAG
jgi:hypothetical protein